MKKRIISPLIPEHQPLVIAGPCSAETEEQVLETAKALKQDQRVNVFRAGVWKPRTRPGSFEGNGSKALPWLQRVKTEVGLPVAIEVANVKHVYEALKAGIDILWIGARTSANPFAVQEIAEALAGVDIPVLVKNPVNPDVALWLGALERLEKKGIKDLGAIHRGVSQFEKSTLRNKPAWQMAIKFREEVPTIPIINDPSHITGNRELIGSIAQTALDLNFDGLMIETHPNPDEAWSDASQQVTPEQLSCILDQLIIRTDETPYTVQKNIDELRNSINYIDDQILELLQFRMNVALNIARFKKENNMTIFQAERWNELLLKNKAKGEKLGLTPTFVSKVYRTIHQESIDNQGKIFSDVINV
ncbi:chorismate mutase [Luteibaculum oceani]|uniref:chorismate mutase n=1 Tax=Luteibaculum oceani TaxID=1294296 RepID=A0A5C6UTX4_9FLAO|nr:chorismate mutase [Luteibaculum oceani]TXC76040.1 3-deoxy-7-phosphoheptulonate synthase [Luteibaculum oceani]